MMKIIPSSAVHDVLERYPTTGAVFLQHGSFVRDVPGQLYAAYDPDLTVEGFAQKSGVAVDRLISRLAAAVEAEDFERRTNPKGGEPANLHQAPPEGSIGYTGSLQQEKAPVDVRSVVSVQ